MVGASENPMVEAMENLIDMVEALETIMVKVLVM